MTNVNTTPATNTLSVDFAAMTGRQLVEWYNANTASHPVNRFSNTEVGVRRCTALRDELALEQVKALRQIGKDRYEQDHGVTDESYSDEDLLEQVLEHGSAEAAFAHTVRVVAAQRESQACYEVDTAPVAETPTSDYDGVSGYAQHGLTRCPHCEVHLRNGVGEHGDDVNGTRVKHDRFRFSCLACGGEFGPELSKPARRAPASTAKTLRPAMVESLKLDRRITHLVSETEATVYENACRVWKAGLVSASQGDRLSGLLYGAAKNGEYPVVEVAGHRFQLTCASAA